MRSHIISADAWSGGALKGGDELNGVPMFHPKHSESVFSFFIHVPGNVI